MRPWSLYTSDIRTFTDQSYSFFSHFAADKGHLNENCHRLQELLTLNRAAIVHAVRAPSFPWKIPGLLILYTI